jgi:CheY-like chemotaxis protein
MSLDNLDFNDVIHGLDKMFNHLIGEDIKITKDLDPDLWTIHADQGTLEQVIMNLVVNARDAMPDGGWIRIKAENKVIDEADCADMPEAQTGKHICFSVTDTGQGIDPIIIHQIFDPFFTTKKSGKGTGLGLSVVYGIVKQHNGWIHVKSKPKRGTAFEVYLPAVPESVVDKTQDTTSTKFQTGSGKHVLVVEDEEKILEFTANGLQKNGYEVSAASSIKEAKQIYDKKAGDFSMVVSDVILPDGNGLDLVNTLTAQNPKLQVILSSGYTDHRSHWTTIKDKGFRFIEKPYDLSDLFRAIEDVTQLAPA